MKTRPKQAHNGTGDHAQLPLQSLQDGGTEERRAAARTALRLIRLREVMGICGLSRSSIYAAIKQNDFPPPVAIGGRARAWIHHEIEGWVVRRVRARRPKVRATR